MSDLHQPTPPYHRARHAAQEKGCRCPWWGDKHIVEYSPLCPIPEHRGKANEEKRIADADLDKSWLTLLEERDQWKAVAEDLDKAGNEDFHRLYGDQSELRRDRDELVRENERLHFEHACRIEAMGAEIQIERQNYADFLDALTRKLNDAGVPAMPSWPSAIDYLVRDRDKARAEAERLREQVAWTVARCNAAMGDGFNGTPNSAVAAVCDELERLRSSSKALSSSDALKGKQG